MEEVECETELYLVAIEGPSHFKEAVTEEIWRKAMQEEYSQIMKNKTWDLVTPPSDCKPIGLRWVFKLKRNTRGEVVQHKARLVAKGYVQKAGVDFEEVFAPVARMETVRLILALAAQMGWQVHQMDVKSAFLNGEIEEEVFVKQPNGFIVKNHEEKVLKLRKALYGLRQAPRAWNIKLDNSLLSFGFKRCTQEHAVYTKTCGIDRLIVGVYVDDLVITGS